MPSKFRQVFHGGSIGTAKKKLTAGAALVDSLTCCPTGSQCGAGGFFRSRC